MKLIILTVIIACSSAAKLDKAYLPPNYAQTSGGSSDFLQTPLSDSTSNFPGLTGQRNNVFPTADKIAQGVNQYSGENDRFVKNGNAFSQNDIKSSGNFNGRPERPRAALERSAAILRQSNDNNGETYSYSFETENGIFAEENGVATNGVEAEGGYTYTGDDGEVYSVRYTAGRNGFVPEGDHLPTPPPVPEEILLALEQNARDEAAGIYDDGSYNENKYENADNGYQTPYFGNTATENENNNGIEDESVIVNSAFNLEGFRGQAVDFRNTHRNQATTSSLHGNNGINQAYLPPISEQKIERNQNGGYRFGNKNRQPSFSARNGYNY